MPARTDSRHQGPTALWILGLIEEFITINDMDNDGYTFGWLLCRDGALVQRLRDGGDICTSRMDEALAFMQNPVKFYRTSARTGARKLKPLHPLNIKPRSIPHD